MRLVRFTQRSYHNNQIIEAGESVLLPMSVPLSAHMIDVREEQAAALRGEELGTPLPERVMAAPGSSHLALVPPNSTFVKLGDTNSAPERPEGTAPEDNLPINVADDQASLNAQAVAATTGEPVPTKGTDAAETDPDASAAF